MPHFEKMLYDNALLLRVYAHWVRLGGSAEYPAAEAAEPSPETADWMLAALGLTGPDGGGAPALGAGIVLDADTVVDGVHHEGASLPVDPRGTRGGAGARGRRRRGPADACRPVPQAPCPTPVAPPHPGRTLDGPDAGSGSGCVPVLRAGTRGAAAAGPG